MFDRVSAIGLAASVVLTATPAVAHEEDLITARGRVGPIQTGETTTTQMREMFGAPKIRKIVRVGCSRVIKMRWEDIQIYAYREDRIVVDVKVLSRRVEAKEQTYRIHTLKGLRVGDSEAKLKNLYGPDPGESHRGHTHYLLNESRHGTRLLAKVVDGVVVQLEAAPYEYC